MFNTIGGPLSTGFFSGIYMVKMENEVATLLKTDERKCWRYSFQKVNDYHQHIKLNVEINPTKFFNTKLNCVNGI